MATCLPDSGWFDTCGPLGPEERYRLRNRSIKNVFFFLNILNRLKHVLNDYMFFFFFYSFKRDLLKISYLQNNRQQIN